MNRIERLGLAVALIWITASPARAADEIHWTIVGNTAVTFDWRGFENDVRYGLTTSYGMTAQAVTPSPVPWSSPGPFKEARLTGLLPDTLYHYSIGGGADHTFRTPRRPGVSDFVVMAEADIGTVAMYRRVGDVQRVIADQRPAFVLMVGDLTYGNAHGPAVVDNHFNDMMVWSQDAAYMPVWGNHEYETGNYVDDLRNYKGRFDLPNPRTSPGSPAVSCCGEDWYWFDYGNVRFIAYPEPWSGAWADWLPRARAVMDSAQADPNITFIVTFGHRPAYSSGHHPGSPTLANYLGQLGATHNKYKLNINGHSHNYERTHPQSGVVHITAGGGGSSLADDVNGTCLWLAGCPPPAYTAFRAMRHSAVKLSFSRNALVVEGICGPAGDTGTNPNDVFCTQGEVFDRAVIPAATPPPPPVPPDGRIDAPTGPLTILRGQPLTFAGTGSDGNNDLPLRYAWDFEGGATNSTAEDPGPVTFTSSGVFTVRFTVTDASGAVDPTPASVVVTVEEPNQPPVSDIFSPSRNVTISPGESVSFHGFAADPDFGTPLQFLWDFGGGAPNKTVEDPGLVVFPNQGVFNVTFIVKDTYGLADPTPPRRTITVVQNTAPRAVLNLSRTTGNAPLSVTASGAGSSDNEGPIASYLFDFGDGTRVGPGPASQATRVYNAGNWTARLTVTDSYGATNTASVPLLVAPAPTGTNLVGNPSAESSLSGWQSFGGGSLTRVAGGFDGNWAMQVIGPASTVSFGLDDVPDWLDKTETRRYRFGVWLRSPSTGGQAHLQIRDFSGGGSKLEATTLSTPVALGPTWQFLSAEHVPRKSSSKLDLRIVVTPTAPQQTLIVDNISITDVGPGGAQPVERTRAEVEATGHAFAVVLQPNPLRGGGAITLSMPRAGAATIEILDLAGRHVRDLMREAHIAAGVHRIEFDGRAADGAELSSGMYFYRVTTSEGKATRRFAILR